MAKATAELQVTGLTGAGVVSSVEELLSTLDGVEYVHGNLGAGKVIVNYDDSATTVETLKTALQRAGFAEPQLL